MSILHLKTMWRERVFPGIWRSKGDVKKQNSKSSLAPGQALTANSFECRWSEVWLVTSPWWHWVLLRIHWKITWGENFPAFLRINEKLYIIRAKIYCIFLAAVPVNWSYQVVDISLQQNIKFEVVFYKLCGQKSWVCILALAYLIFFLIC